jgi:hypothetical protein
MNLVAVGTIVAINVEDKISKANNPYKEYTVVLDNGEKYSAGIKMPNLKVGQQINMPCEEKFGKVQLVMDGAAAPVGQPAYNKPAAKPYQGGSKFTPKPFPLPMDHGDNSIVRQNSLTHAHKLLTESGSYGAAAHDTDILEKNLTLLFRTAYKITEFSTGRADARVLAVDPLDDVS